MEQRVYIFIFRVFFQFDQYHKSVPTSIDRIKDKERW